MFSSTFRLAVLFAAVAVVNGQASDCLCPPPPAGSPWQISFPINALPPQPSAIVCAYPNGACVWDATGALLNTSQGNCESHIADPTACPVDNTGASGELINHYRSYECVFIDETGFHPDRLCSYNAIGQPVDQNGQPVDESICPAGQICVA